MREELTQLAIFIREDGWYPIMGRQNEDWARHAELNPGTLRIEDKDGNILWRPQ